MIIGINKDEGDKILENFLIEATKENGSKACAEESYKILENFQDSQLILGIILSEIMRDKKQISKKIIDFEVRILSAITTIFSECDKSDIPLEFGNLFSGTEQEILDKVSVNAKIIFAVQAFVTAFYNFREFERKYPEITKML
jgi:hypothetical protein